jgi:hypothetical protein
MHAAHMDVFSHATLNITLQGPVTISAAID